MLLLFSFFLIVWLNWKLLIVYSFFISSNFLLFAFFLNFRIRMGNRAKLHIIVIMHVLQFPTIIPERKPKMKSINAPDNAATSIQ